MKINLHRANKLQTLINDLIKSISLDTTVVLTEFHDVCKELSEADVALRTNIQRKVQLVDVVYTIRKLIKRANADQIDGLLTEAALLDKKIQMYTELSNMTAHAPVPHLEGKLTKIKSTQVAYGYNDTVSTTSVTKEHAQELQNTLRSLKLTKRALQDTILDTNTSLYIELPSYVVDLLKKEQLI